ncbi:MAG: ABC transporter permease subunit [Nanoarchaeota archaeon]|nr:ABC transporter permease subunit [Nanoarchaeota archaeon]
MIRDPIKKRTSILLNALSLIILFAAYDAVAYVKHSKALGGNPENRTIPTFSQIYRNGVIRAFTFDKETERRWVTRDSWATISRLLVGFFISIVIAVPIGILTGCFRTLKALFYIPIVLLSKIAPTAVLPIFYLTVGTDYPLFWSLIVISVAPILAHSIQLAIEDIPDHHISQAYCLGGCTSEIIWDVVFKQTIPKIIDTVRLQVGPAIVALIAAELYCASAGYGYTMNIMKRNATLEVVWLYVTLLVILGLFSDRFLIFLRQKICSGYEERR